ncbi:hypothetical protein lerEdw1_011106 [Lerista edwardsae]|nr:hypothetical protein lerEdw1_011106 [Lerista edwardsae]
MEICVFYPLLPAFLKDFYFACAKKKKKIPFFSFCGSKINSCCVLITC